MHSHNTPRTTGMVLRENPKLSEQTAKVACAQADSGGCCALHSNHMGNQSFPRDAGMTHKLLSQLKILK